METKIASIISYYRDNYYTPCTKSIYSLSETSINKLYSLINGIVTDLNCDDELSFYFANYFKINNNKELMEKYYLMAIANKDVRAMNNLAVFYDENGEMELAKKYYLMAIDNKYIVSMHNIGLMYDKLENIIFAKKYYEMVVTNNLDENASEPEKKCYFHTINNLRVLYQKEGNIEMAKKYSLLVEENIIVTTN